MNTEEKRAIPKRIPLLLQNDLERKRTLDNAHATERKGTEAARLPRGKAAGAG